MEPAKQRKYAVAVVALAGCAFLVDRFLIGYSGGPSSALAEAVELDSPAPAAKPPPASRAAVDLAQRLQDARASIADGPAPGISEAFSAPSSWFRAAEPIPVEAVPKAQRSLVVTSIGAKAAVVNDLVLRLGEVREGMRLHSISDDRASIEIEVDGEVRTVSMKTPNEGQSRPAPHPR